MKFICRFNLTSGQCHKLLNAALVGIGLLLLALLLANSWVYSRAANAIYADIHHVPEFQTGLVLGTSPFTHSGQPNLLFRYRMLAAAELYHQGRIRQILVSGTNPGNYYNEPKKMHRALLELGVPEQAITLDFSGDTTLDSIVRAKTEFGLDKLLIISQHFHDYRAVYIAQRLGIQAQAYFYNKEDARQSWAVELREYLARFKVLFTLLFL